MCFSPQRRAIFQHLNFKKCSEPLSFLAFSLENVLLATAACNFSTSQLQKVVRSWCVLYIFTSKCASRHSGVQFLISPLTTWLRTRRFNEPTFRLTRHTNHWKNTAFRDFSNIWRGCIFFLLTFALLHLLSSDSTSSSDFTFFWLYFIYLLFICFSTLHIVGSLLFKLPSIKPYFWARYAARGGRLTCHDLRCTLPETNIAPENGWLEYVGILLSYWEGLFSVAMLVSGSVDLFELPWKTHVLSDLDCILQRIQFWLKKNLGKKNDANWATKKPLVTFHWILLFNRDPCNGLL